VKDFIEYTAEKKDAKYIKRDEFKRFFNPQFKEQKKEEKEGAPAEKK
jgi:hypothetical protein